MIPIESVKTINQRLEDHFGRINDKPNYRIVFSEDEFEMRETMYTDEGFALIYPEIRWLPKYKQYVQDRYILERLTVVPKFQRGELPVDVLSYEPVWVFEDPKTAQKLYPAWAACKFVINTINKSMEEAGLYTKYKHPDSGLTQDEIYEKKRNELIEIEKTLFANETSTGDALAHKYGVGFTTSNLKE